MRNIFILCLCVVLLCCSGEPDHKYRQAVRDYLATRNHIISEEISWGTPDSIFSTYNIETARDYFVQKNWSIIDDLYIDLFSLSINSPQYKVLQDSIYKLKKEIDNIEETARINIANGIPNRIGLQFEYILDNGGHANFIFVFNPDGKTVGHVQNSLGMTITLFDQK